MAGITARVLARAAGGLQAEICFRIVQEIVDRLEADRALHLLPGKTAGLTGVCHGAGESGNDRECGEFERVHEISPRWNCMIGRSGCLLLRFADARCSPGTRRGPGVGGTRQGAFQGGAPPWWTQQWAGVTA